MTHERQSQYGLPLTAIQQLTTLFKQFPSIQQVILYGSRAKGTYHEGSDIDLCLIAPSLSLSEQLAIESQIDELLLPWKVDLSVRHRIESASLIEHIERKGVVFAQ